MSEPIELKIRPSLEWAAMDQDGAWWGYEDKPTASRTWWGDGGAGCTLDAFDIPMHNGGWKDSLHRIIDGRLVKYVDVPGDGEKVIVGVDQKRRYSAGRLSFDGALMCYSHGADGWSAQGDVSAWPIWRRPTREES